MKVYETRKIEKIEKTWVSTKCDGCGKNIPLSPVECYYSVEMSHSDWGNDSVESYELVDFCSMPCLLPHFTIYFADAIGSERYEITRKRRVMDDS